MTEGIDVRLLSKLTFGKLRGVKKHELTRVLCAKHLKDNAIVNRGKSLSQPEVTNIISKLFGESDILASVSFFIGFFLLRFTDVYELS
jgi:hypothetical protein